MKILRSDFYFRDLKNAVEYAKENNPTIFIYPKYADIGFSYHYDLELFKRYDDFENTLDNNGIHSVWGVDEVKAWINEMPNPNVTLFIDGQSSSPSTIKILTLLSKHYEKVDSVKFEQTLFVTKYRRLNSSRAASDSLP